MYLRHISVKKGVLNETAYNIVVYTLKALQLTFTHSQITGLQHYIDLSHRHLGVNDILKNGCPK